MKTRRGGDESVVGLSRIMDLDEYQEPVWSSEDLAAMLRHQLSLPLLDGVGKLSPQDTARHRCRKLEAGMTLGELFADPAPPLRLLSLVKQFAKEGRKGVRNRLPERPEGCCAQTVPDPFSASLPGDLCLVLYYSAIVAARLRCGQRISELSHAALCRGLKWAVEQEWVGEPLGALLSEGLARMRGEG